MKTRSKSVRVDHATVFTWSLAWFGAFLLGIAIIGPGLRPGSLLNLDLVVAPHVPVPAGVWALGPELPRRVPLFVPLAWASMLVGTYAVKLVLLSAIAAAVVGASRLVPHTARLTTRLTSGLIYALSPFLVTRVAVGDVSLVVAYALLPWAVPTLLRPSRDIGRTFLWSAALGVCGFAGGMFVLPIIVVGLVRERFRAAARVVALVALAQLPWIVPGVVVLAGGPHLAGSDAFATHAPGVPGVLRVFAGEGFWQLGNQLGMGGIAGAIAGLALVVLAGYGHSRLERSWRGGAAAIAVIGVVVALGSALPGVRTVYSTASATALGAALREGQRLLPLYLVWLAPAAALGAARLAGRARTASLSMIDAVPALIALALVASALWGAGGRLDPVEFPAGWRAARAAVASSPGTVLALPWDEYLQLHFADDRLTLFPARDWFGGDVIASADPELGTNQQEQVDPRSDAAHAIVDRIKRGADVGGALADIGVRWVFLAREFDWQLYDRALSRDSGLSPVVVKDDAALFGVRDWRGVAWDASGRSVRVNTNLAPILRAHTRSPFVIAKPANAGWLRGATPTDATRTGLLAARAGGGVLWYWPAALTLFVDLCVIVLAIACIARLRQKVWSPTPAGIKPTATAEYALSPVSSPRESLVGVEHAGSAD